MWKHPHGRGEDPMPPKKPRGVPETPPRAWGRRRRQLCERTILRNTPTGVGKTVWVCHAVTTNKKHPHGRGEDAVSRIGRCGSLETPPRAWGRLSPVEPVVRLARNTPTGVGKTSSCAGSLSNAEKHPHGRGEDGALQQSDRRWLETPPRAWGRPSSRPESTN